MVVPRIVDDIADLVLGRLCLGCSVPAPGLCHGCLTGLRGKVTVTERSVPNAPVAVASDYDGLVREVILEYKERGYRSLARPLGWLLADAIWVAAARCPEPIALARIPPHPRPQRGFDALAAVTRHAVAALRSCGIHVDDLRVLRRASDGGVLKTLGRSARRHAVSGAFVVDRSLAWATTSRLIVVDDVVTTGATTAEAVAALARAGARVTAVAAVAATPSPGRSGTFRALAPARHRR